MMQAFKLPNMGAVFKQFSPSSLSTGTSAGFPGLKQSLTSTFNNPFSSLSSGSHGLSSIFSGFPTLKK